MKKIALFQHVWWEGPGKFLREAAEKSKTELLVIKVWMEDIPDLSSYDGLIILGGGPNVDQEDIFPFLRQEKKAIKTWLNTNKPCLGICLGHQLLAEALGARIDRNFCYSIGYIEGHLTHNGKCHPVFNGIKPHLPLFKWHGYAVIPPVPGHFHILATSTECQVEAFTIKDRPQIIGVQFDNHAADPEDVALWLHNDNAWISAVLEANKSKKILTDSEKYKTQTRKDFLQFFENFINMVTVDEIQK